MSSAECECGFMVHHVSTKVVATEMYRHVLREHPNMKAMSPDVIETNIHKARRYGPDAGPIILLYPKVEPTPWTAFFGRSSLAGEEGGFYAVRRKLEDDRRKRLWKVVRELETPHGVKTHMFDHGTAACVFLDGGITRVMPAYFGRDDTWIHGSDALRLLCYKLGLVPRRRLKGETRILTGIELEAELVLQRECHGTNWRSGSNGIWRHKATGSAHAMSSGCSHSQKLLHL